METKINGLNEIQISAVFEALLAGKSHPCYATAKHMAEAFVATQQQNLLDVIAAATNPAANMSYDEWR